MFDRMRAELIPPMKAAVLPCGCVGVVISHDDDFVHFGIEESACDRHRGGDVALAEKGALVTPLEPSTG